MLSRKQQAISDFLEASQYLRQIADDRQGTGLLDFTDSLIQSIAFFGMSEIDARQAERYGALDIQAKNVLVSSRSSTRLNEKGLKTLSYAREELKQFRKDFEGFSKDINIEKDINILQQELREELADLEIKASDVEKIDNVFTEFSDFIIENGANGLPDYLEEQVTKLERLRQQRDRGASENIPVWKVAAIAIAVGVWVWALFRCRWWGGCSRREGLSYAMIIWINSLIAKFC